MTESPRLFESPLPRHIDVPVGEWRHSDPLTSVEAGQRISGRTERLVLEVMPERADWTADDLCHRLPTIFPGTLKSSLKRLQDHLLIEPTGATRPSDRGCASTVYRVTDA